MKGFFPFKASDSLEKFRESIWPPERGKTNMSKWIEIDVPWCSVPDRYIWREIGFFLIWPEKGMWGNATSQDFSNQFPPWRSHVSQIRCVPVIRISVGGFRGPEQNCTALADLKKKCPDYNEFRNSLCKANGQRIRSPYSGISIDNPLKDRLQFIMQWNST